MSLESTEIDENYFMLFFACIKSKNKTGLQNRKMAI